MNLDEDKVGGTDDDCAVLRCLLNVHFIFGSKSNKKFLDDLVIHYANHKKIKLEQG